MPDSAVAQLKGPRARHHQGHQLDRPIPIADGFTGDVLTVDAAINSSFPNGRRVGGGTAPNRNQVNVNSVLISLIAAGDPGAGLAKGVEVNDKDYLDRFPFLAIAHQGLLRATAAATSRQFRIFPSHSNPQNNPERSPRRDVPGS